MTERIYKAYKDRGLSIGTIARLTGLNSSSIWRYLHDESIVMNVRSLKKLCEVLKVSADYIIWG